jgi:hypothetical protein
MTDEEGLRDASIFLPFILKIEDRERIGGPVSNAEAKIRPKEKEPKAMSVGWSLKMMSDDELD